MPQLASWSYSSPAWWTASTFSSGSFSIRQVHIMRCYWLPKRPIGIPVPMREFLHQASTYPALLLAAWTTNRNSRSYHFSLRQVLVHILCCHWLPERPIGIFVLFTSPWASTSAYPVPQLAVWTTNRNSRSYKGASPSGKHISCAAIGCLNNQ